MIGLDRHQENSRRTPAWRRSARIVGLVLLAILASFTTPSAAASVTLKVESEEGLPGFHRVDLLRFLVTQMAAAGLADWRFEPADNNGSALDRVEWSFKLNPYAGGEVRNLTHTLVYERQYGVRRPITIEVRLYLNGQYQTLVEKQAIIRSGPDDPELASVVATVTQSLLGPTGAYRAIDVGQRPTQPAR